MNELPQDYDAERATLGSVFSHRDAIVSIAPWLTPSLFYAEKHAWIYQAMLDCYRARVTPNYRTVADRLKDTGRFDAIGLEYLIHLDDDIPHGLDVDAYARRVENAALLRGLAQASGTIAALAYNGTSGEQALDAAQSAITKVATMRSSDTALVPFSRIVEDQYTDMANETPPGIPTGFRDLDELLGGLHRQDLLILGARPSVGKTSMAGCLACNVAEDAKLPVLFFSLEMDAKSVVARAAAMASGVNLHAVRQRALSATDMSKYMVALGWAHKLPIYVDDMSNQSVMGIRNKVLRFRVEYGDIGLVVIDYLQLMEHEGRPENRVQEVSKISRGLKQLAREADVPVLALSQLSRSVEGRTSHIPMLSDLRESGSIEQDADIVLFLYREELYDNETDKKGVAEVHIAKHRNGPIGVVPMRFDASTTSFHDLSYRTAEGY